MSILNWIHEYLNINSFKNEESDKMSVDSAHIQGACGSESMGLPVVSGSHSLTIDAEYVSVSQILSLSLVLLNRWTSLCY